ncbi:MAG: reverse transcriptase family protein, partial [Clostridiales bacterium]
TDYFYRIFYIKKKNGRERQIKEPLTSLKEIQHWILNEILYKVPTSRFSKAYTPNKNLIENIRFHRGQEVVINFDIKDFFPSIKEEYIYNIFKEFGYCTRVSLILAKLCCVGGVLPQGAPTSPYLSNIYLKSLDKNLSIYCIKNKIRYTRYADDMTFSGNMNINDLFEVVKIEVLKKRLVINSEKTKIMTKHIRQVVTGVVVNCKLQLPIEKRKQIRQAIYFIRKYGLESHLQKLNCSKANYIKHLMGKVNYALFINPNDQEIKLYKEFLLKLYLSSDVLSIN